MADLPVTRVSLLVRLRDGDDTDAWGEFLRLYAPVVYGFARKRGLQDADAADLMQEVLRSVAVHAGKLEYDRARGTFRGWLFTITRNKVFNFLSARRNRPRGTGDSSMQEQLNSHPSRDGDGEDEWERDYQRQLSARAMERVRGEFQPATWQAFWQTAVEGNPAQEVGERLKMSPGAVYVAKSRVLARLRDEVRAMQDDE